MTDDFETLKKDFNDLNFSLIFSVVDSNRMNVTITDRQEKNHIVGSVRQILTM